MLALIGFAANSLLCRAALGPGHIDAASFTAIRLATGAVALAVLAGGPRAAIREGSWPSAFALFLYAAPFSLAYVALPAGTGALLLFGAVQVTMLGAALARGERPSPAAALGWTVAVAGLVVLVRPGLSAPSPWSALLMALAGAAWGVYTLRGRASDRPLLATAGNFVRAVPLAALLLFGFMPLSASPRGAVLAAVSGALASGVGYALWYTALPSMSATQAAVVQLAAPALAAAGGVVLLGEPLTARLVVSAAAVLGGVALAVRSRQTPPGTSA